MDAGRGKVEDKIASNLQVVSKRLESLGIQTLDGGATSLGLTDVNLSQVLTQQLFQYYDCLSEAGIVLEVELVNEHLHYATDPELWERSSAKYAQQCPQVKGSGAFDLDVGCGHDSVELRNTVQQPIQHLDQLASRLLENLSDTEYLLAWVSTLFKIL